MKRTAFTLRCAVVALAGGLIHCGDREVAAPSHLDAGTDSDATNETPIAVPIPRPSFASPREAIDIDADPAVVHVKLTASRKKIFVGGEWIDGFAYNDQVPGPTIRARVGDKIVVDLDNRLDVATTIHWHGMSVPYEMDGVTWKTDPIGPKKQATYSFVAKRSGTFWYHPHFDTARQVDLGLYGVLIVEDPVEPKTNDEIVMVFDTWGEHAEPSMDDGGMSQEDEGRLPRLWTINSLENPLLKIDGGRSVRARLVNASNHGYLSLHWPSMRVIASDQGLLQDLEEPERLVLAPGDRAEVEILVGEKGFSLLTDPYSLNGGSAATTDASAPLGPMPTDLLELAVDRPAAAPAPTKWPFARLASSADPAFVDLMYVLSGDYESDEWFINGEQYPKVTIRELPRGFPAIVEVRNLSSTEHPFHVHGHAFEVLSRNGVRSKLLTIEDTINLGVRDTVRLRLVADNPGDWMLHCHILGHADSMMTVLRVLSTP